MKIESGNNFRSTAGKLALSAALLSTSVNACNAEIQTPKPTKFFTPMPTTEIVNIPTPKPSIEIMVTPTPATTENQETKPNVVISEEDSKLAYERFNNRKPLSESDLKARDNIIQDLRNTLGIPSGDIEGAVFQNGNVRVEYVSGPNDFEAEILVPDFKLAKEETMNFFKDKGLSVEALCWGDTPIFFYAGGVSNELPAGTHLNPNPDECK